LLGGGGLILVEEMALIQPAPPHNFRFCQKRTRTCDCVGWLSFFAATATGCDRISSDYADIPASQISGLTPTGKWIRPDNDRVGLKIFHKPQGAWVVESFGTYGVKRCSRLFAGSLNGAELVASGDADAASNQRVLRDGLVPGEGLFVTFKRKVAIVSGPEADAAECPLAGDYVRSPD